MADMDAASEALMRQLHREINGLKPRSSRGMASMAQTKPAPPQTKSKDKRDSESEASSSGSEDEVPMTTKHASKRQSGSSGGD